MLKPLVLIVTPSFLEAADLEETLEQDGRRLVLSCTSLARAEELLPAGASVRLAFVDARVIERERLSRFHEAGTFIVAIDGARDMAAREGWALLERPFTSEAVLGILADPRLGGDGGTVSPLR